MHRIRPISVVIIVGIGLSGASAAHADDLSQYLKVIQKVSAEGAGNREAAAAWRKLAQADVSSLPVVLAALDDANPLAANWLRSAAEAIADRELKNTGKLPAAALEKFVLDASHDPRGRRLAFDLLTRVDATAADRLVPGMLNDPSVEFRAMPLQRLLDEAAPLESANSPDAAQKIYLQALQGARDLDQVEALVKHLAALGQTVDLPKTFWICPWIGS